MRTLDISMTSRRHARQTSYRAKARRYLTGLGMYAATVNGRPIGDGVLEPGRAPIDAPDLTHRVHLDRGGTSRWAAVFAGEQVGQALFAHDVPGAVVPDQQRGSDLS